MKNRWNDQEALQFTTALDERVYTSRLLGQDPELVMHGGGNTSLKAQVSDLFGKPIDVLFIKGSGWDLASIEKPGFPGVRMANLIDLRSLAALGDVEMMNYLRGQLVDSSSPDPSVETLLHAFLPHRFVDHTHADAILTLTNRPNGEERVRSVFGNRVGIVPYVMPGFLLAKLCAETYERDPSVEGLVLLNHGIFTFGDTAKQSYDRMIELVQKAEDFVAKELAEKPRVCSLPPVPISDKKAAHWMAALRTSLLKRGFPAVLFLDRREEALRFVDQAGKDAALRGPLTPDHVIRTKRIPCFIESTDALDASLDRYRSEYDSYFIRCSEIRERKLIQLDPWPRVILVPSLGIVTVGKTAKECHVAQDIYRHTISVIQNVESVARYQALREEDIFDVEYWVLEQAKLKLGAKTLPLTGKIAIVTGGGQGIGRAICEELNAAGALVYAVDIDPKALGALPKAIRTRVADVSLRESMEATVDSIVAECGGLDIVVANAGIFPASADIESIPLEAWQKSMRVNVDGAFHTLALAIPYLKMQKRGGDIVFIASKNAPAPGKGAGAYSVAKAAQTQLARVAALECGKHGIRINTLHPHQIFDTALWTEELIAKRAAAYGLTPEAYKRNNLLETELTSRDVARATFALVSGAFAKTTGAQIPIDGGSDRTL